VKHVRIILDKIAGTIAVVGICIKDGEALNIVCLSQVSDGDYHIIEAAEAAKIISSRMMTSGANEGEAVVDLPSADFFSGEDYATNRVPAS
jgi:hypothetical protein